MAIDARGRLREEALVVRGGRPPFPTRPLQDCCDTHPDGPYGFSVESDDHLDLQALGAALPHRWVGLTTVQAIRKLGYDVVRTSGSSSHHATVVVPEDWSPEAAEEVAQLFQPEMNPSPRQHR